jgi:V8-like Glu-specific endopeptidase
MSELEPLLHTLRPWLSRRNIVGLSAGTKTVAGQDTGEPAIVVHVKRKLPADALGPDDLHIPAQVGLDQMTGDGRVKTSSVATDVIEVGVDHIDVLDQRVRPVPGAYQIKAKGVSGTGTLGVNIVWAGKYRLLTNNHVISENGHLGADVYEPSEGDDNKIGTVDGYVPVITYPSDQQPNPTYNTQDLAYCLEDPKLAIPEIKDLGVPKGIREPKVGERIRLIGKQTATVKTAKIASITLLKKIEWPSTGSGRWAWFERMIQLDAKVTQPGDSGSAYVAAADDMVVGLHVASNDLYSWGCQLWPY